MARIPQRTIAYITIGAAVGEVMLPVALSWVASLSLLSGSEQHHLRVHVPLFFAILPLLAGVAIIVHLGCCRHVDRSCPWIGLAWLLLAFNILALALFMQMSR